MKKVLVFNTFNFAPGFAAPMASEVQDEIDRGNNVTFFTCNKAIGNCGFNIHGLQYQCSICTHRKNTVVNNITGSFNTVTLTQIITAKHEQLARTWLAENQDITLDTQLAYFDIGAAVLSSYISKSRDRDVTLTENFGAIKQLAFNTAIFFFALQDWMEDQKFDKVVLFNGRWDYYRAVFRTALHMHIPVTVIEVLRDGGYVERIPNNFPHAIQTRQEMVDELWNNSPHSLAEKQAIGASFFTRKRKGDAIVDISYTTLQQQKKLPEGLNLSKPIITLFNSSDDEFVAMGSDYVNPYFESQQQGIEFLIQAMQTHYPDVQFVIRMHPNLKGLPFSYVTGVTNLKNKFANVFVELPESSVDSYALLDISEKIIVFGSTIGFEACYFGKAVILAGSTYYSLANVAHTPKDRDDLVALIGQSLQPKPQENAIKIGYYYLAGGEKSTHFNFAFRKEYSFKKEVISTLPMLTKYTSKVQKALQLKNSKRWVV